MLLNNFETIKDVLGEAECLRKNISCKKVVDCNDEKQLNCKSESLLIPRTRENLIVELLSNRT